MSKTLQEIAELLRDANKKVQLIYAFNGSGKTRLSREFKELISPKNGEEESDSEKSKVLYYNAFTEDLFYWDNDLEGDRDRKLIIRPNAYTQWVLQEQGQDQNAIAHFQRYTNPKLTPQFNPDFSEVTFSFERGNEQREPNIKISKGEESNFIWSIFYSLLEQIIEAMNSPESGEDEASGFEHLEYIFIDDPVSSLDENHLMQLAVDLALLIKKSTSSIKFIVSTHDTTFYNFLHNELNSKSCYLLDCFEDNTFSLVEKNGDSNTSFFYHLDLKRKLELAIKQNSVQREHFILLRNLYEKTASFLGYPRWSRLLPGDNEEGRTVYLNRVIQFSSHNTLPEMRQTQLRPEEKQIVRHLLAHLMVNYKFWKQEVKNDQL